MTSNSHRRADVKAVVGCEMTTPARKNVSIRRALAQLGMLLGRLKEVQVGVIVV